MAQFGGHQLTSLRWTGSTSIVASFDAPTDGLFRQLYAGKTLIGCTGNPEDREVVGQLRPSAWPQLISLVAVNASERLTEFGDGFGVDGWNRAQIRVSVASLAADAQRLEITAGTVAGGAVDDTNVLGTLILEGDGTYTYLTDPMEGGGTWNFEVTPYDNKGNAGTALATSVALTSYPPDVVLQSDGSRLFGYSIAGQTLNLSVVIP